MDCDRRLEWIGPQQQRLDQFDIDRCADIHCHCLPGLDDGPEDMSQAVALCAALAEDGITTVVATPHQLGRYDRLNGANLVRERMGELVAVLAAEQIPLEILPGGDVRIDERLPKLLDAGEITSLAGADRHILLELPHELLVDPVPTIRILCERGLQTILTHPERHPYLAKSEPLLRSWVDEGAVIQLTAGSLLGDFGQRAYNQAWRIVHLGLASLVATDAHDTIRRPPRLSKALALLTCEIGAEFARSLCLDNPLRVLRGEGIEPPQPIVVDA